MNQPISILNRLFHFYYDGFRNLSSWGKKVWTIIIIKVFILFVILKIFFFRDFLNKKYDNDIQRCEYVLDQITNSPLKHD